MFLRAKLRRKDGKEHRSWSVVENQRVGGGRVVQRHVLYLGEINSTQALAWRRSRKPVNKVEDLAGLKIRVLQTPGFVETYKAFGTQPTPMAYGELFLALQNGVVDALEISPDAFVNDRFVEVIPNYALTKAHQSTTVFIVSKAKFEALPSDVRSMARTAAREAIKHGLTEHARLNREGLATARAKNVTIVEPELAPFKAAARRSYDTILAEAPEGRAILNEIEAAKRSQ